MKIMTSLYLNIWNKVLYVFALVLRSGGAFNKSNFILRDKIINGFMSINEVKNLEFDINYSGYKIKLGLESYIYSKVFFYGLYERCELEILSKYAKKLDGGVFLDVGANVGVHSLYMSKFCEVHSFEPYKMVRDVLNKCILNNNISNIHVYGVALSDHLGKGELHIPMGGNHGMGFIDSDTGATQSYADHNLEEVKLVHGDDFIIKHNIKKVGIVKIDVEGYEKIVLTGLKKMIERDNPILLVEYTKETHISCDSSFENFMDLFPSNYEFKMVKKDKPKYKLIPIKNICFLESVKHELPYGNIICKPS
jgi:FkbM family methyltransferase